MLRTLLAGTALAAAVVTAGLHPRLATTAAQPPGGKPVPPEFKLVPADAAVFAHVNVEQVWTSKVGDTFRKVNAKDINEGLKFLKETAGVTIDDVTTATLYVPKVTVDGPPPVGVIVNTRKPYDRDKLVAYIRKQTEREKEKLEELPGNKYRVDKNLVFDLGDTKSFRLFFQHEPKEAAGADGPISPAVKAAAAGAPAVLGVAFGNLPDEIRQENVPAEVRPFQPFFFTESAVLTGEFVRGDVVFTARFKGATRAKAVEAEKSLGALKTLVEAGLTFGVQQLEKDKAEKRLLDFVKAVQAGVKGAKITHEDNTPTATLALKADTDYAPFLEFLFGRAGGAAARAKDTNNLKQLGLAMHNYHDVYGACPPAALVGRRGKPLLSWRVMILPFVEQDPLYKKFKLDESWDSPHNKKVLDENPMPPVYALPGVSKPNDKTTHYQVFVGGGALFDLIQGPKFAEVADGTSNTLLVATAKTAVPWTKPADIEFDPKKDPREVILFASGVSMVAFADGSVRAVSEKAKAETWKAVITKAGGEVVGPNDF